VGQGDAFVIENHQNKKTVLLDTSRTYQHNENRINLSDKTLLPYLKEQGVDFIDVIIISHLDLDHSGEVLNILSKKNVGNIIMNTEDVKFDDWLKNVSYEHRGLIRNSGDMESFSVGNIHFDHLIVPGSAHDSNEQSVVLKAHLNIFSILFTGDIGLVTEAELTALYNLESDILKVGHHGSDTSSGKEFINAVEPEIALISAGVNNRYGHPHSSVIENLAASRIISTKDKGMVEFSINHDTICISAKFGGSEQCLKEDTQKE